MGKRRWILWHGLIAPSMERFVAVGTESGFQLSGLILQAHQDVPYVVRYSIEVDEAWRTHAMQVEIENDGQHRTRLVVDGTGRWSRDGKQLPALDQCLDVLLQYGVTWKAVALSGELG